MKKEQSPRLEDIRSRLTSDQQQILDEIWERYLSEGEWSSTRKIHAKRGKQKSIELINALGGNYVIGQHSSDGFGKYELTILGVFCTSGYEELEKLYIGFLEVVRQEYEKNPEVKEIPARVVQKYSDLDVNDLRVLGELIYIAHFGTCSHGTEPEKWTAYVNNEVEELAEVESRGFLERVVLRTYDSHMKVPVDADERFSKAYASRTSEPKILSQLGANRLIELEEKDLEFVGNEKLRKILVSSLVEAVGAFRAQLWKSTIIQCCVVLEGLLLDALIKYRDELEIRKREKGRSSKPLENWDLVELVVEAQSLDIISKNLGSLSNVVRDYRNLVHPGKHLREKVNLIDEHEAQIALNTLKLCIRDLNNTASLNTR